MNLGLGLGLGLGLLVVGSLVTHVVTKRAARRIFQDFPGIIGNRLIEVPPRVQGSSPRPGPRLLPDQGPWLLRPGPMASPRQHRNLLQTPREASVRFGECSVRYNGTDLPTSSVANARRYTIGLRKHKRDSSR